MFGQTGLKSAAQFRSEQQHAHMQREQVNRKNLKEEQKQDNLFK